MKTDSLNPSAKSRQLFPWERNGLRYFTNGAGERICTGSQMGRSNSIPADAATVRKLHLRRVRLMDSGGCYDKGGAYWGNGSPLFCAWGESDTEQVEFYTRAKSREEAKTLALAHFPGARFYC